MTNSKVGKLSLTRIEYQCNKSLLSINNKAMMSNIDSQLKRKLPLTIAQMKKFCDHIQLTDHKKIKRRDEMEEYFWENCLEPVRKHQLKKRKSSSDTITVRLKDSKKRRAFSSADKAVENDEGVKPQFRKSAAKLETYHDLIKYLNGRGHKIKSVTDLVDLTEEEVDELIAKTKGYNSGVLLQDVIALKTKRLRSQKKIREIKTLLLLEALANNMCSGIKKVQAANSQFTESRAIAIIRSSMFNKRGYRMFNFKCKTPNPLLLPKVGDVIVLSKY